eukprot:6486934-Prymnesium_polylepis.1
MQKASVGHVRVEPQHVPIIDAQRDVHALIVGNLKEVARAELGLREALFIRELVHGSAIPYPPGVGLA